MAQPAYVFRDYIMNLCTGNNAYVHLQGQSSRYWRKLTAG
jgi:hypothetical protein